jgi:carboxypeptidase C (cathepsin A)
VFFFHVETEAWFIDSFEEWRKAKNLSNFVLLGHSFGGYVAAKYAIKVYSLNLNLNDLILGQSFAREPLNCTTRPCLSLSIVDSYPNRLLVC